MKLWEERKWYKSICYLKKKKKKDTMIISFKILDDEMKIFGLGLDCAKNGYRYRSCASTATN